MQFDFFATKARRLEEPQSLCVPLRLCVFVANSSIELQKVQRSDTTKAS
jgi:hypothetical protein